MPRYFIEVAYKGTNYSGFQIQKNANSIQAEIQKALKIFYKRDFELTGSSRTDAGVHALQNFFHFDVEEELEFKSSKNLSAIHVERSIYNLNAILPLDVVIKKILLVKNEAHCRFDAVSRQYKYFIYQNKNPFLQNNAFYFPYNLDIEKLNEAASKILMHQDFTAFSKQNTQVNNFNCSIEKSSWYVEENKIVYDVVANRFLRGMVKGLTGTMLQVGANKISVNDFVEIIKNCDQSKVDFSPPSHGLFLMSVKFKSDYL